ncbi:MAG: type II toxin-antitoxin system VapC family toxin [Deltaproteobacteria bacterium]|nr:type II toxin-antitoxin system VapC family toxin [Deltaproteobacteria bacterium]
MKTAIDTSVLLDVLAADPVFGERSREALRDVYRRGALVACDIVWSEVRAAFGDDRSFADALTTLGVQFDPVSPASATLAGTLWQMQRGRNRADRLRVVPDFLVGAHAILQCDALLTRDRGFYRDYFTDLRVLDPSV